MQIRDVWCTAFALVALGWIALSGEARAQSGNPQTTPSPWSLHEAVGAPENLKLSATFRIRLDAIDGQPRAGFNPGDTVVNMRTTLFAEYDAGPIRFGAEIYDSRTYFGDPRTALSTNEVNAFEPVQAYAAVDLEAPFGQGSKATVQAGRFVLNLGARRLVAADDFRNTTNGYTGVRADLALRGDARVTAIWVLPQFRLPEDGERIRANAFALDREGLDLVLWGGLAAKANAIAGLSTELQFYRLAERDRVARATRDRRLYTGGIRLFRSPRPGKFDGEIEAFYQWGAISASLRPDAPRLSVSATFVHADIGYTFDTPWRPRLSLRYDRASGDGPGPTYARFDTLFGMRRVELAPSGLYNAVGRANLSSPAVRLEVTPGARSDFFIHYRPLWLASATDAFSTSGVRDPAGASGSFAGHQTEVRLRHWLVTNALRFEAGLLHLAKGRFLRNAPGAANNGNPRYVNLTLIAFF